MYPYFVQCSPWQWVVLSAKCHVHKMCVWVLWLDQAFTSKDAGRVLC